MVPIPGGQLVQNHSYTSSFINCLLKADCHPHPASEYCLCYSATWIVLSGLLTGLGLSTPGERVFARSRGTKTEFFSLVGVFPFPGRADQRLCFSFLLVSALGCSFLLKSSLTTIPCRLCLDPPTPNLTACSYILQMYICSLITMHLAWFPCGITKEYFFVSFFWLCYLV